ncbi:DnaD domain-containing protein [Chloroflexota bacterium]
MKPFHGFPARMTFTPIPNLLLNRLMPDISDITELKTTLHIMEILYRKKGYPRFVTFNELLGNSDVIRSLKEAAEPAEESLHKALEKASKRETLLHLAIEQDGKSEDIYFLNTPPDRQTVAKIQNGELKLPGLKVGIKMPACTDELPNIFTLYEDNIGMLTPMISEELKEAERLYPITWIQDAIKEAVNQGKRKWSYTVAILESWSTEGRSDGAHKRDSKKDDPDKYIKGKYGHMVQR